VFENRKGRPLAEEEKEVPLSSGSKLLCVVGPTASGKTALALELARRYNGEILSADMGQMYRQLNAGTAKPEGKWVDGVLTCEGIPYHLIDVLAPEEPSDAGRFSALARPLIKQILERGKRPIVAGGSGLYIRALVDGLDDGLPQGDSEVRKRLTDEVQGGKREEMYAKLQAADPEAARRIPAGNTHRLVRALEVLELTGEGISKLWKKTAQTSAQYDADYVGIAWEKEALNERIALRAAQMFPAMLGEVRTLLQEKKYSGDEPGFRCLGYPQALNCLRGNSTEAAALESMIASTRKYAKRQRTWFKHQTPTLWLSADGSPSDWAQAYHEQRSA
jgi:tRNA dimethylallyltransferase